MIRLVSPVCLLISHEGSQSFSVLSTVLKPISKQNFSNASQHHRQQNAGDQNSLPLIHYQHQLQNCSYDLTANQQQLTIQLESMHFIMLKPNI